MRSWDARWVGRRQWYRLSAAGVVRPVDGSTGAPRARQDIADYLGLTIETVSRTLTQLAREGVIDIPVSRRIVLCNRASLNEMNDTWDA